MLFPNGIPDISALSIPEQQELLKLVEQYSELEIRDKSRRSFLEFIKVVWPDFISGRHHKEMADAFQRVISGDCKRLIINMPPRHTKSEFASVHLPAYFLGMFPKKKIIQCSHTAELAVGFGRKVRDLVQTDSYKSIFPDLHLKSDSKAAGRWATSEGGDYFAIGVGGAVTGKGADLLIIDDPHALAVHQLVPTTEGFKRVDEIEVGNFVFGPDGKPTEVIAKSRVWEGRKTYTVETDDFCQIECDGSHLWSYRSDTKLSSKNKTATTKELMSWDKVSKPCLPRHSAVEYPYQDLLVPPYVLGAWLGDGTSSLGRMTSHPDDAPFMRSQFENNNYETTSLADSYSFGVRGLRAELRTLGVLNNKHIPEQYMIGNVEQRMALVQGLMDTDGTVTKSGQCSFQNTNLTLVIQFRELLHSLGVKAKICEYTDSRRRHQSRKTDYRVNFKLKDAALIPRKRDRTYTPTDKRCRSFSVREAYGGGVEADVQCITVARPDGLFLVGRGYVVTHNSEQEAVMAESNPAIYDSTFDWYMSGPRQRLQPNAAIVVVMTRWSKRDVTAQILESATSKAGSDDWEVIEFPAILPSGNALWPEYWSLKELETLKSELPVSKWQAQYQQDPTSEQGAILKKEWWKEWPKDKPPECDLILCSADTAFETKQRSDYSAVTTWGVFNHPDEETGSLKPNIILLDAWRDKLTFPGLKVAMLDHYKEWEPDVFIIEGRASGKPLIYELRSMGIPISEFNPVRGNDKISRVNSIADIFSSGMVWAPTTKWADEVITECADFPAGKHDDFVDTVSQAMLRFRQGGFLQLHTDDVDDAPVRHRKKVYY